MSQSTLFDWRHRRRANNRRAGPERVTRSAGARHAAGGSSSGDGWTLGDAGGGSSRVGSVWAKAERSLLADTCARRTHASSSSRPETTNSTRPSSRRCRRPASRRARHRAATSPVVHRPPARRRRSARSATTNGSCSLTREPPTSALDVRHRSTGSAHHAVGRPADQRAGHPVRGRAPASPPTAATASGMRARSRSGRWPKRHRARGRRNGPDPHSQLPHLQVLFHGDPRPPSVRTRRPNLHTPRPPGQTG